MYRVGRLAMVCVLLATLLLTGPAGVAQAGQAPQAGAVACGSASRSMGSCG